MQGDSLEQLISLTNEGRLFVSSVCLVVFHSLCENQTRSVHILCDQLPSKGRVPYLMAG